MRLCAILGALVVGMTLTSCASASAPTPTQPDADRGVVYENNSQALETWVDERRGNKAEHQRRQRHRKSLSRVLAEDESSASDDNGDYRRLPKMKRQGAGERLWFDQSEIWPIPDRRPYGRP